MIAADSVPLQTTEVVTDSSLLLGSFMLQSKWFGILFASSWRLGAKLQEKRFV